MRMKLSGNAEKPAVDAFTGTRRRLKQRLKEFRKLIAHALNTDFRQRAWRPMTSIVTLLKASSQNHRDGIAQIDAHIPTIIFAHAE